MANTQNFEMVIQAGQSGGQYWRDLWRYRELFYILAWRDICVRYKQTVLGIAWSVVRPVLIMIVFTIVFGRLAKLPSNGVPYPILVFTAMLPWQFFSNAFVDAGNSLIGNTNMISKVYFPRIIIPTSAILVSLVDFAIAFLILFCLMFWYGFYPDVHILIVPMFIIYAFITVLSTSIWIAALNVRYRDFRYIIPFIVQFGLYVSPVGFSSDVVPEQWRLLYSINPMVGVIDGFRWAILGDASPIYWPGLLLSVCLVSVLLLTGFRYFCKTERTFADVI
jgi:lipopolysaccharide transport system permease protein